MPVPGPLEIVRFTEIPGPPASEQSSLLSPASAESTSGPCSAFALMGGVVGSGPLRVNGTWRTDGDCAETANGNKAITRAIRTTTIRRERIVSLLSVIL